MTDLAALVVELSRRLSEALPATGVPMEPARVVAVDGRLRVIRKTIGSNTYQWLFDAPDAVVEEEQCELLAFLANHGQEIATALETLAAENARLKSAIAAHLNRGGFDSEGVLRKVLAVLAASGQKE